MSKMRMEYLWALITLIIAIALAIILISLTDGETEGRAQQHPQPPCLTTEDQDQILTIVLRGIDDALEHHIEHLFAVFLQDPSAGAARAQRGTQNSIGAYIKARELAHKWRPPVCLEGQKLQSDESKPFALPPRKQ